MVEIRTEGLTSLYVTPANSITRFRKPEEGNMNLQPVTTSNLTKEMKKDRKRENQGNKQRKDYDTKNDNRFTNNNTAD
jgi:hypothetical protein